MKQLVMTGTILASAVALAMPTKEDFKAAEPIVSELMAPTVAEFKAKKKTAAEVGEVSVQFAEKAETEAAKYLLYKGAVSYLTRGEEYDKAADAALALQSAIPDIPAEDMAEVISRATVRATAKKAPRLFALYRRLKTQAASSSDAQMYERMLKKKPVDLPTRRKYAEALAAAGNWQSSLEEFAKLKDSAAKFAKEELAGTVKASEAGEFWWAYESSYEKADETFKVHAASFYRQALGMGQVTGLKVELIKRRIEPYVGEPSTILQGQFELKTGGDSPFTVNGNHATLTLKNGAKLEFVKCPPGKVDVAWRGQGREREKMVTKPCYITRPFWIMTTPLKCMDLDLETKHKNDYMSCFPVAGRKRHGNVPTPERYGANISRGTANWLPKGYVIRLPSLAEFQYSFRAGSTDPMDPYANYTTSRVKSNAMRCLEVFGNGKQCSRFGPEVRITKKNNWGLHEYRCPHTLVLDRIDRDLLVFTGDPTWSQILANTEGYNNVCPRGDAIPEHDPFFWTEKDESFQVGFLYGDTYGAGTLVARSFSTTHPRFVIGPDLVSEWREKHAKK